MRLRISTILRSVALVLLLGGIVYAFIWTNQQNNDAECTKLVINVINDDSTKFVTDNGILQELNRLKMNPLGKKRSEINLYEIERALRESDYLENVECVLIPTENASDTKIKPTCRMEIRATQMLPVMRVFNGDQSYYVNAAGKRISATAKYFIDVPVVNGRFSSEFPPTRIMPLIEYVENDSLLKSLFAMYTVRDSNNIFLIPNIYGHVVNIGNEKNYKTKLQRLLKFYKKVMPVKGWGTYDTITLKWDKQVVASRRFKVISKYEGGDDDSDDVDWQTMTVSDGVQRVQTDGANSQTN